VNLLPLVFLLAQAGPPGTLPPGATPPPPSATPRVEAAPPAAPGTPAPAAVAPGAAVPAPGVATPLPANPPGVLQGLPATGAVPTPQPAQAAQPPQQDCGGMWTTLIFFGVMILVFWLLIIRPQQKQKKKMEQFLSGLKSGDRVVTASGIIGRIVSIDGEVMTLELAKDVRIKVLKSAVASQFKEEGEAKES